MGRCDFYSTVEGLFKFHFALSNNTLINKNFTNEMFNPRYWRSPVWLWMGAHSSAAKINYLTYKSEKKNPLLRASGALWMLTHILVSYSKRRRGPKQRRNHTTFIAKHQRHFSIFIYSTPYQTVILSFSGLYILSPGCTLKAL